MNQRSQGRKVRKQGRPTRNKNAATTRSQRVAKLFSSDPLGRRGRPPEGQVRNTTRS